MKKVISTERIPIKLWLNDIEESALSQIKNLANLPFTFKHIAVMPDAHTGYGMPIGGVMATKGVIIPNAVGVDIGCGMCVVKTSLTDIDNETLKKLMSEIRQVVPVGFKKNKELQNQLLMPDRNQVFTMGKICEIENDNALNSLGTLGGGNHFIEVQKGSDGFIWIMIHSGSRNLGYKVAKHYNKLAVDLNEKWFSKIDTKTELAFLPIDSQDGKDYIKEMNYCIAFAFANRKLMMDRITNCFSDNIKGFSCNEMINIAHNYAELENHFNQNVWVHRKGATKAYKNMIGIIPGSQGTKSYIVKGLGNVESFKSCSHGAGRLMSRKGAIKNLDFDIEVKKLEDQNIIHSIRGKENLDEASGAYKDIKIVMDNQSDLVEIMVELSPLAVIKG